jgi:S-adenosylmethionine hydrolase
MSRVVTLLTDFGTADGYVGEMKGILLGSAPDAVLADISHDVTAQDVDGARLALARYWQRFPVGTVHVFVVDPGVGSSRAAIAVESEGRYLVGPDNGVLSPALLHAGARCVELPVPAGASATFHGRDVFAPAAAALARGTPLDSLGETSSTPIVRRTPEAMRRDDGSIAGEVITVDRFGNAVTNLVSFRGGVVEVGGQRLPLVRTYADVASGEAAALVGSSGLLEVAMRDRSAAAVLGLKRGRAVGLHPAS